MRSKLAKLILDVRGGFWLLPLVMLAAGIGLGLLGTALDQHLLARGESLPLSEHASPGGARDVLSVAAGALATTLAISLSITMVTVQLGASQYTPRLLRRFLSDRFAQGVLGSFLGTIAFLFIVLRAVRSPDEGDPFVPVTALTAAVALTLACLGLLVVFLHRTMRNMQASTLVSTIGRETIATLREVAAARRAPAPPMVGAPSCVVRAAAPGYIQLIDDAAVRAGLPASARLVRRDADPGDFVIPGSPLVSVFGPDQLPEPAVAAVRAAFTLGSARTPDSDVSLGIRQLVDIALKALSPGINDVTTAVMVVNELGAVLQAMAATGDVGDGWRLVEGPAPAYVIRGLDLERSLELAYGEITACEHRHPRVLQRIAELLALIADQAPSRQMAQLLARHQREVRQLIDGVGQRAA